MKYNDYLFKLLSEIATKKNFEITGLSDNYIIEIKDKNTKKTFYIYGNRFPLNNASSQKICSDKSALSDVLALNKIPHVIHTLFKHPKYNMPWKFSTLKRHLVNNPQGLVIKDNFGSCGNNVYLVKTNFQLKKAVRKILKQGLDISLSPYVNYENEYRLIMLDGICMACYKKVRPFVKGDGKTSLRKLVFNKYAELNFNLPLISKFKIPKKDEKITVGWKHNLKMNSIPENITDEKLKNQLVDFAKKVLTTINIKFCSVDLIFDNTELKVLEINSIVSMNEYANYSKENYKTTKEIFTKAIEASLKL